MAFQRTYLFSNVPGTDWGFLLGSAFRETKHVTSA
jgi:hypothetical protein